MASLKGYMLEVEGNTELYLKELTSQELNREIAVP
jgi:hypothetical protein